MLDDILLHCQKRGSGHLFKQIRINHASSYSELGIRWVHTNTFESMISPLLSEYKKSEYVTLCEVLRRVMETLLLCI